LRWGYDGGGVACGPVEGSTIVEVCVTDNEKHNHWIIVSRMSEFERVFVSPMPLFDALIHANHYDVDFAEEFEKCETIVTEGYDYEIYDPDEEMEKSEFAKVIRFARNAMKEYYGNDDEKTDAVTAYKYFEKYYNSVVEELDVSEVVYEDDDDYDDDEE